LLAQHAALSKALSFEEGEVDLITLPVFVLANLASGMTSVLAATDLSKPGSPDVGNVRAQCQRHKVMRCAASPAFFEACLASDEGMFPLKKLYTGGAPVFPDLLNRLHNSLPSALVHSVYGSTEAEPIAHFPADGLNPETRSMTLRGGGLCAGHPVPEIKLRVIRNHWGTALGPLTDTEFNALEMPPVAAGEIIVSGDHVLSGYLDGLGNEETKILVGEKKIWHRTGDAGWIDDDGKLWLLGRCSEKLTHHPAANGLPEEAARFPFAIECAMRAHFPGVRMAALDWKGDRMLACGQKFDVQDETRIRNKAADMGITRVVFLESLPLDRRHNAKIDYPALRKAITSIAEQNSI
jgi:acyl-CoA synthetase (AMP-forming)/AMP-acid ligase II